jgi:Predicted pyridoxal phosphate-dependent enzyme apparently involved in regulation of cell wall biogenesis
MDNVQAGILNYRFEKLNTIIRKRRNNAKLYFKNIKSKNVLLPLEKDNEFNTYHTFVIQTKKRNLLQNFLKKNGVQTAIHYPIPIHLQKASKYLGHKKNSFKKTEKQSKEILTLPINEYLTKKEIIYISNLINNFFKS